MKTTKSSIQCKIIDGEEKERKFFVSRVQTAMDMKRMLFVDHRGHMQVIVKQRAFKFRLVLFAALLYFNTSNSEKSKKKHNWPTLIDFILNLIVLFAFFLKSQNCLPRFDYIFQSTIDDYENGDDAGS